MILQALYEYYQRKAADPESGIAPQGFEWKEIPFVIVVSRRGSFVALEDTRIGEGKHLRAKAFLVPQGVKRAGKTVAANLLWDNLEYAIGADPRGRDDVEQRALSFRQQIVEELPSRSEDARVDAILHFLEGDPVSAISSGAGELWQEAVRANANVTFRIDGDDFSVLSDAFKQHIAEGRTVVSGGDFCLVSGGVGAIAATHPSIKGVKDAQSSGGAIVSFNESAYTSFGKRQNYNAPVSAAGTFAYTTALNHLLARDSNNKVQVGDATTVFWSERSNSLETSFLDLFAFPPKDDPDRDVAAVRSLYRSLETGALQATSETRFYVLGLSPNAARIAIRFWLVGTVQEFATRLRQHFDDLEIVRSPKDQGRYSLFWLLLELATERKVDNVPPNLSGALVRAVLTGTPYPTTLMHQTVRRIRAEQTVSRMRAAILKAYLNRLQRSYPNHEEEITVSLDPENKNVGYRLGRLFALLEKIQEDASPGLNATIRDRYYGAASANPVTVFPQLLKLKNHHLKKIDKPAWARAHERRLTDVFAGLPTDMPTHLRMEDQARFAIGYYHQRQALYTKASAENSTNDRKNTEKEVS